MWGRRWGRKNKMYFSAERATHTLKQENVKLIWGQNETIGEGWRVWGYRVDGDVRDIDWYLVFQAAIGFSCFQGL